MAIVWRFKVAPACCRASVAHTAAGMTPSVWTCGYLDLLTCRRFVDQGLEMLVMCARSHRGDVCSLILRSLRSGCLPVLHPRTEVWESLVDASLLTSSADTLDVDESSCEQSFCAPLMFNSAPGLSLTALSRVCLPTETTVQSLPNVPCRTNTACFRTMSLDISF